MGRCVTQSVYLVPGVLVRSLYAPGTGRFQKLPKPRLDLRLEGLDAGDDDQMSSEPRQPPDTYLPTYLPGYYQPR